MKPCRNILRVAAGGAVLTLCAGVLAASPENLSEISAGGLLAEAANHLSTENYGAALPYLTHYLERMEAIDDARVAALKQAVRLKLGKVLAHLEDPLSASGYLKQYTENLPRYKPREALKLLALTLYESGQYEACIAAATRALSNPLPVGLDKTVETVNVDKLSKKDMAGFSARQIKRIEKEAAEAGTPLTGAISADVPDAEPDYTTEELVFLHMTLAEACTQLENWQASIKPYRYVIDNAVAEDRRGYAIMQMVNSLIALERFDEAGGFIKKLYRTNARYDIRVNMALMSAAAALYKEAEYNSALLLYRMVLPRSKLVAWQEIKMNELRRKAGLPRVDIQISTNETGRVNTLFGSKSADMTQTATEFSKDLPPKPPELLKREEAVETLVSLPAYEEDVMYRIGLLFARAGRPWEAVEALETVAEREPDTARGQDAFAESLMVRIDPLKKYDAVEERGRRFLNTYSEGLGPRRVAQALTTSRQKQENWQEIKELLPVIEGFVPSDDPVIRQYECELYYMQAIADIMLLNYSRAKTGFERVLMDYPDSHRQEDAVYWHAMSQLFLKNYPQALDELEAYAADWPNGSRRPSAAFYSGVCLFSLEKYEEARARFTHVIETWPEASVYSDACSMRADLLASKGRFEKAQSDYEEAIASATLPRQASYAVFQMASMFELEERYEEILQRVNDYLDRYGEDADVAKAAYWIGKVRLAQNQPLKAVEAYRDAIVRYGGRVRQDGVDLIIAELIDLSDKRLEETERDRLKQRLRESLQETDNVALQLRLRVLLASLEGTVNELGGQLITELDNLTQVPPPVLSVICNASLERQDFSRAAEILDIFQTRFEDSEFMRAAYKLRATGLFMDGKTDEAMAVVTEAQALYGPDPDAAWAQILKGRIHTETGLFDEAEKDFRTVLSYRKWSGAPCAEAAFRLGEAAEKKGDLRTAFGWYQRTCVQYKAHAGGRWAAEAYLAGARCLQALGLQDESRTFYRAMLFDPYVNRLPQAEQAEAALGAEEAIEIRTRVAQGTRTNLTVILPAEETNP